MKKGGPLTTLTLGGGAFVFPAYLERHYPGSINEVAELDREFVEVAHDYFDFPRDTAVSEWRSYTHR